MSTERKIRPMRGVKPPEKQAKREQMDSHARNYFALKKEEKALKAKVEKTNKEIKIFMADPEIYTKNGKHREYTTPMGDGKHNIVVQVQLAESIKPVDNLLDLVRAKLGDKAEQFVVKTESLVPNALESMLAMKLIKEKDVLEWVTSTTQERLTINQKEIEGDE